MNKNLVIVRDKSATSGVLTLVYVSPGPQDVWGGNALAVTAALAYVIKADGDNFVIIPKICYLHCNLFIILLSYLKFVTCIVTCS